MRRFVEVFDEKQIQPAGIDLSIGEIEKLKEAGEIDFDNKNRKIPEGEKIELKDKILLRPGAYRIRYRETVEIPKDCVGLIFPRSSLLRMGATIFGAVWDPGYIGKGQGLLVVFNPAGILLHRNARVGQLILLKGKETEGYSGKYRGEGLKEF